MIVRMSRALVRPGREVYQSRWRDEASLAAFAGPAWRREPVVFPGEEEYLREPLQVTHFAVTAAYPGGR